MTNKKSTKDRTETHACDLISRQAAIDAVKKHYRAHDNDLLELITFDIEQLPPAQPDVPDTNVGDTISRQAAIDAAELAYVRGMFPTPFIREVPPAQPKRKKGKWIQNDNGTYSCSLCHSWIPEEQYYYAQFCLYCGADMREAKVKYGDEETLQGGLMSAT